MVFVHVDKMRLVGYRMLFEFKDITEAKGLGSRCFRSGKHAKEIWLRVVDLLLPFCKWELFRKVMHCCGGLHFYG